MFILFIIILLFFIYQHLKKEVPILMYHRIALIPNDRNTVSPLMFEQQLQYLKKHGYTTISLQDLYYHFTNNSPLPSKSILLTFDDGYEDNLINALPLLKKYGMTATVCVISNWIGKENGWEQYKDKPHCRTMDLSQLQEWLKQGMSICAHTANHPFLSKLDNEEILHELINCKSTLEEQLHIPIEFLCYPYGDFDDRVKIMADQVGYKAALGIFKDTHFWERDLLSLKRVVISSRQPLWEFAFKVSSLHMLFIGMRILEYRIKQYRNLLKRQYEKNHIFLKSYKTNRTTKTERKDR
ncbi:Peptidoglycan/xylan/chitin deacetylase, PgdA/CDA1 family [Pelosinus fermentans]|uniref:polysaccharide deacetylase family protein n=1 Tax=Pelosinus fermentans TaxID=365349 RepID=UPI0002685C1E|nr:polysaccharide deacetylase family protein [Pelosinus fermentans]OAM92772.1 polysaccharide deacetylase [Pelosinus fermentans DSM 17108]SDQ56361.1 Peptidoglycan/xylan/chitin deacetylase, PgdA/CDA1 family [Pelosinus fermentans]